MIVLFGLENIQEKGFIRGKRQILVGRGRSQNLAVLWIHLGPWIQRYKMKGKAEFNQQFFFFFRRKLYFSSIFLV